MVENFQHAQQKGFLIDMMKCSVEAGNIKPFTISWMPKIEVEVITKVNKFSKKSFFNYTETISCYVIISTYC